jgi:hypothetical protein
MPLSFLLSMEWHKMRGENGYILTTSKVLTPDNINFKIIDSIEYATGVFSIQFHIDTKQEIEDINYVAKQIKHYIKKEYSNKQITTVEYVRVHKNLWTYRVTLTIKTEQPTTQQISHLIFKINEIVNDENNFTFDDLCTV